MIERYFGVLLCHLGNGVFPELEGFQHVGFVHTGDFFVALHRRLEGHMRDALNLGHAVAHGVKGFLSAREMPIGGDAAASGLTEIDVTREFADDENV